MSFNIKKILNVLFQISIIFLIVSLFYSDDFQFNKIKKIFTKNSIDIFFLLIFLKILISFLFSCITIIISKKKLLFFKYKQYFFTRWSC